MNNRSYYALVNTDINNVVLKIRASNCKEVKNKIYKNYKVKKIIKVQDKPFSFNQKKQSLTPFLGKLYLPKTSKISVYTNRGVRL